MKKVVRATAIAGVAALALAACGQAPEGNSNGNGSTASETKAASNFQACMVTDAGGVDDRSFNASAWKGLQDAEKELGVKAKYVESNSETDYAPNVQQMVADDCGIIVTVGFLLGDATKEAAEANPEEHFAIVDFQYEQPVKNIRPLIFDTAQAAFLAGYVAADSTKTGTVATFGGINIPTVSIFMDGFADGVAYYNQAKGKKVKVLGWDKAKQNGSFTGDFNDQNKGKNLTNTFIQQGADIVMPVAGPVGLGAAAAAQEAGDVMIIGVDSDWYESAPQYKSLVLTSVVKEIDNSVLEVTKSAAEDKFTADPYVGTLENEGVSIAPFHDFESKVSPDLQKDVDDLKAKIVSGEVKVESPSSPKS
ncbi:MAG TPA: BMP family ABC transporter substrate-binding protein [Actinomycetales bacterium]|nr:BMP family ABC transporter substrate-binding protein [Actinomycetales bacterium]